ncbi:endonuclease/exonuclease/phosphatase family protein [Candidatus Sulfidibacterium hydrothermale]|uniref:endonuclease/exonuclease/phosphatase family protein n=1 Tax=Candidatus Sulfidibacterium hydrothermale TaxID=2875962 RepID=UPI001F0A5674|nr:endonuclease/exonuclease/phosphatase family protein [Candidatus Sulfidibacterium hydrothermale]UBM61830.1 endonuclease/exonuclease/phosphatase family protein [Candidatus Sulfidibacterium hydrothermale]
MKKYFIGIVLFIAILTYLVSSCRKDEMKPFSVAFYNVENLFDTIDNPNTRDNDHLPDSKIPWNTKRYKTKLEHIAKVMAAMNAPGFPTVFGLAEVENKQVVEDLIHTGKLKDAHYKILHKDSPDERGIDVALLYQPKIYKPVKTRFIRIRFPSEPDNPTRDILYSKGLVYGMDTIHIFVNHWVSRYGGKEKTDALRRFTGHMLRLLADSIFNVDPNANILIMGDLNDNPTDKSLTEGLGAIEPRPPFAKKRLYNLAILPYKAGKGSLYYKHWDLFDQVIVSTALVGGYNGIKTDVNQEEVFKKDWMLYHPKKGPAVPNRTAGRHYYGGYSDHLPVMVKMKVDLSGEIFTII